MDISGINIDKASLHTDYFKIPVPADYSIKVTVKKDEKGKIIRYEMAPVHSYFEPEIEGLFTTNGCFVALPDLKYEADHKSTTEEDDDSWLYMKAVSYTHLEEILIALVYLYRAIQAPYAAGDVAEEDQLAILLPGHSDWKIGLQIPINLHLAAPPF